MQQVPTKKNAVVLYGRLGKAANNCVAAVPALCLARRLLETTAGQAQCAKALGTVDARLADGVDEDLQLRWVRSPRRAHLGSGLCEPQNV